MKHDQREIDETIIVLEIYERTHDGEEKTANLSCNVNERNSWLRKVYTMRLKSTKHFNVLMSEPQIARRVSLSDSWRPSSIAPLHRPRMEA